eukprot:22968-Chlamydomonas_euryale.AAC.4
MSDLGWRGMAWHSMSLCVKAWHEGTSLHECVVVLSTCLPGRHACQAGATTGALYRSALPALVQRPPLPAACRTQTCGHRVLLRRKYEEREAQLRAAAELEAKEALERKRSARREEDQRMRQPWQQPPPPKKDILRAKQKQKPVG